MADVIKEFLVALGFAVNQASLTRTQRAIAGVGTAVKKLSEEEKRAVAESERDAARRARAYELMGQRIGHTLGSLIAKSAITVASLVGVSRAVEGLTSAFMSVAKELEGLQKISQRTGASVANIRALQHAFEQIGGTSQDAMQAVEGLAGAMRSQGGMRGFLSSMGVTEARDAVKMLEQLVPVLSRDRPDVAIMRGGMMGLSPEIVRLLTDPKFPAELARTKALLAASSVDMDKLAKATKETSNAWSDLFLNFKLVAMNALAPFMKSEGITKLVTSLSNAMPKILGGLSKFSGALALWFEGKVEGIAGWLSTVKIEEIEAGFEKFKKVIIDIKDALVIIAESLKFIVTLMKTMDEVGTGAGKGARWLWENRNKPMWGPGSIWEQGGASGGGAGGGAPKDERTILQKVLPKIFGGKDAPVSGAGGGGGTASTDITPEQRGLLEGLAAGEAGQHGYKAINYKAGGGAFSDFSQHPFTGKKGVTAAGRYQMLATNWDRISKDLGLKDFSPENQDKAALQLAREDYATRTGRNLDADLKDPSKHAYIGRVLTPTWHGIPGNFAQIVGRSVGAGASSGGGGSGWLQGLGMALNSVVGRTKASAASGGSDPSRIAQTWRDAPNLGAVNQFASTRLGMGGVSNDNSSYSISPTFNTNIHTTGDSKQAATIFQRANEELARMPTAWITNKSR